MELDDHFDSWRDALSVIAPETERDTEGKYLMVEALAAERVDLIYEAACYVYETDNQRSLDWRPDSPLQALADEIIRVSEPYTSYATMGEFPPISAEDLNASQV